VLAEPFVLALPARHALGALRRVPAKKLAGEPFIMFPRQPGLVFHDLIMGFCLRNGFTPRVAQEANQTHTVVGLVSAGIGVALVPESTRRIGLAGVTYRPLREATPQSRTAVAWRRGTTSPVLAAFLDVARRVAKQVHSAQEDS
jgi:DNA-binding transcriptional LysR family regulator